MCQWRNFLCGYCSLMSLQHTTVQILNIYNNSWDMAIDVKEIVKKRENILLEKFYSNFSKFFIFWRSHLAISCYISIVWNILVFQLSTGRLSRTSAVKVWKSRILRTLIKHKNACLIWWRYVNRIYLLICGICLALYYFFFLINIIIIISGPTFRRNSRQFKREKKNNLFEKRAEEHFF